MYSWYILGCSIIIQGNIYVFFKLIIKMKLYFNYYCCTVGDQEILRHCEVNMLQATDFQWLKICVWIIKLNWYCQWILKHWAKHQRNKSI